MKQALLTSTLLDTRHKTVKTHDLLWVMIPVPGVRKDQVTVIESRNRTSPLLSVDFTEMDLSNFFDEDPPKGYINHKFPLDHYNFLGAELDLGVLILGFQEIKEDEQYSYKSQVHTVK